ncbi:MAG: PD-(D/E)XK nuclease family protein [Bacteroidales bacterium]
MKSFLGHIASSLLTESGNDLSRHCLVFPNRRAGLYFNKYLSELSDKPLWAPKVTTINELFNSFSGLIIADNEILVIELYRVYKRLNIKAESFDAFYFWGEMLVNDFDNIDKYLVDHARVFSNLKDIREIDARFGGLTDDQVKIIRQFWANFKPEAPTNEKEGFLELWNILPALYSEYRQLLRSKGLAYEGMVFRDLAELCMNGFNPSFGDFTYHFIGFNALNKCERQLMNTLREKKAARFYWDYDDAFVNKKVNHPAGFFINQNLMEFGNSVPEGWDFSSFRKPRLKRNIRVIESPSDVAQVKTVSTLLSHLEELEGEEAHHTAVVLADENLLVPVLTSLPENASAINITMGYPLRYSPVYSLIRNLLDLQKNARLTDGRLLFSNTDVKAVLQHSYVRTESAGTTAAILQMVEEKNETWIDASMICPDVLFNIIFKKHDSPLAVSNWIRQILESFFIGNEAEQLESAGHEAGFRNEFIYRTLLSMNRLDNVLDQPDIIITLPVYLKLLERVLRGISVPFTGEPLSGLQVMGILETRALDFKNLYFLSVNEGVLPRAVTATSFIPYNIREAFGLPVIRHQDSIYSYYFYRLIQRAENVTILYNSSNEGLRTGEMSRFIQQLKYLEEEKPVFSNLSFEINPGSAPDEMIERSEQHATLLESSYLGNGKRILSPSAINTWLNCSMRFFYRYVANISEPVKPLDEIDPALFGEMLHSVMEKLYSPFTGKELAPADFKNLLSGDNLENLVNTVAIGKLHPGQPAGLSGSEHITSDVLKKYAAMILKYDGTVAPLSIIGTEAPKSLPVTISHSGSNKTVSIGGVVDRLDKKNGRMRIVDYKTGNIEYEISSIESLFDSQDDKRGDAWFQVLMYCKIITTGLKDKRISPAVYSVRKLPSGDFTPYLNIKTGTGSGSALEDYADVSLEYSTRLKLTIENIFDRNVPFVMTNNTNRCKYCPYIGLCGR